MSAAEGKEAGSAYEILVRGKLADSVADELGATKLVPRRVGTLIVIEIIDQSHLHGVLQRLFDCNIDIESVKPAGPS